jgi:hypothetical protein
VVTLASLLTEQVQKEGQRRAKNDAATAEAAYRAPLVSANRICDHNIGDLCDALDDEEASAVLKAAWDRMTSGLGDWVLPRATSRPR